MAAKLKSGARGDSDNCNHVTINEALIHHFEAIVMAARNFGARKGDSFEEKCQPVTLYTRRQREPFQNILT